MTSRTSAGTTSLSLTLLAASLDNAIVMLDATVVNVAMERIKASLGTDVTGLQWVMSAYTIWCRLAGDQSRSRKNIVPRLEADCRVA
jgi:hypothetical protein